MNSYKILSTNGAGELTSYVTAIDEKDARRIFKKQENGKDMEIVTVELIRENVPATKAQERDALERIRAIIATLGPRSYVGTALEGCLEDAEVNIENDFGDSMKACWQAAERRVAEAVKETAAVKEELAQVKQALKSAEDDADFFRDKVIDSDDLTDIAQLIEDRVVDMTAQVEEAAGEIVEAAEEPGSIAFTSAVTKHRAAKSSLAYYTALAKRIEHARGQ